MQDARTRGALIALALLIFGGSGAALYAARHAAPPPVIITPPADSPPAPDGPPAPNNGGDRGAGGPPPKPTRLYVDVAGAVRKPSLYALAPGSRVMQAVKAAGGPSAQADLDSVNLAERVRDGEKVYIPHRQPQAVTQAVIAAPPGNTLGHATGTAPAPQQVPSHGALTPAGAAPGGGGGKGDKLLSPSQGHVGLNTATAEGLQRLPGIGPAMAARILAYRTQAHGFRAIEDLQDVGGIGPKKFAKIAPFVTLN